MIKEFENIVKKLADRLPTIINGVVDPSLWALDHLGIDLYDNQIEIVNEVCNLQTKYLAVLQARGSGKSFSVALGLVKLSLDNPGFKIGVFGPKTDQATRIIKVIRDEILTIKSADYSTINWDKSTNSRLTFINGSEILALSASPTAQQEGHHFHCAVIDENHRVSDISFNQRIIPMIGSYSIGKIIKIGIPMFKNNFWKSCCHPQTQYKVLKRDYTECAILLVQGSILYKGKEYPKYALDQMPLTLKQKLFPDRPDLHYDGSMTELDFKTQYMMEWVQDVNLELSEEDQLKFIDSMHDILSKGRPELQEQYFFGLDTAAGSILPGKKDLDFTSLSIWRKRSDNVKEKVAQYFWQSNVLDQIKEIREIVHPVNGLFQCKFGLVDYSNIGINIVEAFKSEGVPIEGIMFNGTEPTTHKNYKNAMFDQFKFELQSGRVKYPKLEKMNDSPAFKKAFNEWLNIERHIKMGINAFISAPSDLHDDAPCSDIMAVWSADRLSTFKSASSQTYKIPLPVTGVAGALNRNQNSNTQQNRYLND